METEKIKMLSGRLYSAFDDVLINDRSRAKALQKEFNVDEYIVTNRLKNIQQELIPNAPGNLYIEPPFNCDYGYNIYCGDHVYFNVNCVVLDVAKVTIGSNVFFGPGVHIYTATHPLEYKERRTLELGKPVTIGNDCWIGGGVIILPGVIIGDRCIIGAGTIVTKDVPNDSLAVGNPARVIRKNNEKRISLTDD